MASLYKHYPGSSKPDRGYPLLYLVIRVPRGNGAYDRYKWTPPAGLWMGLSATGRQMFMATPDKVSMPSLPVEALEGLLAGRYTPPSFEWIGRDVTKFEIPADKAPRRSGNKSAGSVASHRRRDKPVTVKPSRFSLT